MTNIGWDRINRPTVTGEWGQPHFWGAGEDDWGLMGWSGYALLTWNISHIKNTYHLKVSNTFSKFNRTVNQNTKSLNCLFKGILLWMHRVYVIQLSCGCCPTFIGYLCTNSLDSAYVIKTCLGWHGFHITILIRHNKEFASVNVRLSNFLKHNFE